MRYRFLLGGKRLDQDDWVTDADRQGAFGFETTFGKPDWPVAVALDYIGSANGRGVPGHAAAPGGHRPVPRGPVFNGGAFWRLGKRFNIGVDVRLSTGEVRIFGEDVQAGGVTTGLLLGWGWGGGE